MGWTVHGQTSHKHNGGKSILVEKTSSPFIKINTDVIEHVTKTLLKKNSGKKNHVSAVVCSIMIF